MTRVDVFYRRDGEIVPRFDQYSVYNELNVRTENGMLRIETVDASVILLPVDLIRKIELTDCGD